MNDSFLGLIEAEIRRRPFGSEPRSLYEPIRYIMSIGGKRLRPMLTLLSYSLYRKDVAAVVPFAVAVEAFHNFTLMHDDIMDNAPLRRGKTTVHNKWNVPTAILSGDVMLVKVYEMFQELPAEKLKEILPLLNECASGVCEGQQLDMEFESKKKVTEAEYVAMIRLKTALLLGFSLELGARLASAPAEDCKILREAGIDLGTGFQLTDDLLDVYAPGKKFGKRVGGDIISNKRTFLLIKALESARGKTKEELDRWLVRKKFDKREKVKMVSAIFDKLGVRQSAEKRIAEFFEYGFNRLQKLSVGKEATALTDFARSLVRRQN